MALQITGFTLGAMEELLKETALLRETVQQRKHLKLAGILGSSDFEVRNGLGKEASMLGMAVITSSYSIHISCIFRLLSLLDMCRSCLANFLTIGQGYLSDHARDYLSRQQRFPQRKYCEQAQHSSVCADLHADEKSEAQLQQQASCIKGMEVRDSKSWVGKEASQVHLQS